MASKFQGRAGKRTEGDPDVYNRSDLVKVKAWTRSRLAQGLHDLGSQCHSSVILGDFGTWLIWY